MLKSFFALFGLMITPLYLYRIDIENAYILYKGLIEKFKKSTKNLSKRKKTPKKKIKKTVRKKNKKKK